MLCCGPLLMSVLSYIACGDITESSIFYLSCNKIRYKPLFQDIKKRAFEMEQCKEHAAVDLFPISHFSEQREWMCEWWFCIISWAQLGWAGAAVCAWLQLVEPHPWEPSLIWPLLCLGLLQRCPGCRDVGAMEEGELAQHLLAPSMARKVQLPPTVLCGQDPLHLWYVTSYFSLSEIWRKEWTDKCSMVSGTSITAYIK